MSTRSLWLPLALAGIAALGACAARPKAVAVAPPPAPPPPVASVPMPDGGYAGMSIPERLADGGYATPNRALSEAATVWHLRAGLNVAALACRGTDDAVLVGRYNALLVRQRLALRDAEARLAAEYRGQGGGEWRVRYDAEMTSLYNFFSQSFARDGFCRAAAAVLADSETVEPTALPAFAAARLPLLDMAFTDFYARYDAWLTQTRERARIEIGPVAALPEPDGREVVWSPAPVQLAAQAMK